MRKYLVLAIQILFIFPILCQEMTVEKMESILKEVSDEMTGENGAYEITVSDIPMLCLTSPAHNRMRIISPASKVSNLKKGQIKECLEANFHTALDVKYAISDDIIWSVYIHPLRELTRDQLIDAISQVRQAVVTFGESYSSTNLMFPMSVPESETKKL